MEDARQFPYRLKSVRVSLPTRMRYISQLRQNLNEKVRDYANNLYEGLGDILTTRVDKKGLCALVLGMSLGLTGCGHKIDSGEIYDKLYEPERKWVQMMMIPQIHSTGSSTYTTFMIIPIFHYDDEDFVIKIRRYNEEKEKFDTRTFYVDKETYERLQIGNYFSYNVKNARVEDKVLTRKATEQEKKEFGVKESS